MAADCHPDHDTICAFRRQNVEAVSEAFLQVLLVARELKLLKVGTMDVDGTELRANASKRNSIRHDRAVALRQQLRGEIDDLLGEVECADVQDAQDSQGLPEDLINLTDSDSALMRKNKRSEYRQCYNAHAVVDAKRPSWFWGIARAPAQATAANWWRTRIRCPAHWIRRSGCWRTTATRRGRRLQTWRIAA